MFNRAREKLVIKSNEETNTEQNSRPIFDPNIQLHELWFEDFKVDFEYTICLKRFSKTMNDKRNFDKLGYVKFLAISKMDIPRTDGRTLSRDKLELFVIQLPYRALTMRWLDHADRVDTNFSDNDNLLLTFKRTSKKRIMKLRIINLGDETEW